MRNYAENDYALNVNSENIVYNFADGIGELTLEDFLAENPAMTEADFLYWKSLSNEDYFERDRKENAQSKKNLSYDLFMDYSENDGLNGNILFPVESAEDALIGDIDMAEDELRQRERLATAKNVLNQLTEIQRRRYLLHHYNGMTTREIAETERVSHVAVVYSIESANKKIEKFLKNAQKVLTKTP